MDLLGSDTYLERVVEKLRFLREQRMASNYKKSLILISMLPILYATSQIADNKPIVPQRFPQ